MSHDTSSYPAIPIGVEDFKEIIDNKNAYVDKTLLIKEFWQDGAKVILTPRPRRFGKTLNLSMLKYFFEKPGQNNANLFKNTNIWAIAEYRDLQGQFPVIFLTFKDIKAKSWESAYEEFASIISEEYKRILPKLTIEKIDVSDIDIFNRLKLKQAPEEELTRSLQFLSRILHEQTGKKVIILIDEYDAPIIEAYLQGYYEKMIQFMRSLLSKVLKTNPALEKGFLTGITRTAKEGIFSGLNNLSVYTTLNIEYSNAFGFTQKEVDQLLINYNLTDKKEKIKHWYDEYVFGQTNIYNPWSLLHCIKFKGNFDTYWANTSGNELVKKIIAGSNHNVNQEVKKEIELLLQGYTLADRKVNVNVTMSDLENNNQEPWSFLLFTGYLTTISSTIIDDRHYYSLAIPNKEISYLYQELVLQALNTVVAFAELKKLFNALIAGDIKTVEHYLQEFIINNCSFYDLPQRSVYKILSGPPLDKWGKSIHMLVLGLLAGLADRYKIQSNRESGYGRYDIMLMPRTSQGPGILIELKRAKNKKGETLALLAQEALEQIKNLNYKAQMRTDGYLGQIFCYGVAVSGKQVVVTMEVIMPINLAN